MNEENIFGLSLLDLTNIVITVASSFPENHFEASSSVTLATREEWSLSADRHIFDVLNQMPSTVVFPSLGSGAISIRGYGGYASIRGISTLIDGVPVNTLAFGSAQYDTGHFNLATLDRIEIIRGPGSAIYGSDAFHGVLSMQSYHASRDETVLNVDFGSDLYYQTSLRHSLSWESNARLNLAIAVNGQPDQNLEYRYTDPDSHQQQLGQYAYRQDSQTFSVNFLLGEDFGFYQEVGVYANHHSGGGYPGVGRSLFSEQTSVLRDRDHADLENEFSLAKYKFGYHFDNKLTLEAGSYFWHSHMSHFVDLIHHPNLGYIQETLDRENRYGYYFLAKQANENIHTDWTATIQEDKIRVDKKRTLKFNQDYQLVEPETIDPIENQQRKNEAFIFQAKTWLFDRKLAFLYGGRYDEYSDFGLQKSPRLGLIVRPHRRHAVKLLAARAYRPPTASEMNGIGVAQGNPALTPETIKTLELIHMYQAERWRTELVLFRTAWKDGIELVPCLPVECVSPSKTSIYKNTGDNVSLGIEWIFEGKWQQWASKNSITYSKSENEVTGVEFTASPTWIINSYVGYHFAKRAIDVGLTNRLYSDMTSGPLQANFDGDKLETLWQMGLHVSKKYSPDLSVYINIDNLLDRDNRVPSIWDAEDAYVDRGRVFTLGAEWRL